VSTRPHALRRLIGNLLDNAVKYAGAGEIETTHDAEGISISVLDRGPGIPEDRLDAVLQPFYRLEGSRSRETGGAGLGLAIAQQLALSLGATLELRNREGGGLQATLLLPR
jgi:signal transduction histidine kinase